MTYKIIPPREPIGTDGSGRPINISHAWWRYFNHIGGVAGEGNVATGQSSSLGEGNGLSGGGGPQSFDDLSELVLNVRQVDNTAELSELRTLAFLRNAPASIQSSIINIQAQLDDLTRVAYEALFKSREDVSAMQNGAVCCCLPMVNGDTPGPALMADGYGQCIAVPIGNC